METLKELSISINRVALDPRLKPSHISLYVALCNAWIVSHFQMRYNVSRRRLMETSRIQSKTTYHKMIRDLQKFGYVHYEPSYHPMRGSQVSLVK